MHHLKMIGSSWVERSMPFPWLSLPLSIISCHQLSLKNSKYHNLQLHHLPLSYLLFSNIKYSFCTQSCSLWLLLLFSLPLWATYLPLWIHSLWQFPFQTPIGPWSWSVLLLWTVVSINTILWGNSINRGRNYDENNNNNYNKSNSYKIQD